ncbi:hypothetical protein A4X13_0g3257 [Tilletia indica]|uniref:Uncharacterized protein n=1 Tax=Tilletia indica TaxID=43049 RepID=A0A177T9M0_9BASI|nr:hypothetical protein A4X13_0g3257 [Tilletia indica]
MFTLSTSSSSLADALEKTGIFLPVAGLFIIVLAFAYNDRIPFSKPRRQGVYYPKGALPILGHSIEILKLGTSRQLHWALDFTRLSKIGGWQMSVLGLGNVVFLSRPEYIEAIQKTNFDNFEKGDFFRDRLADVLGQNGIFVADGAAWKHSRKTASHIFSAGQFRNWVQVVVHEELDKVISILNGVTSKEHASDKKSHGVINMPELFFRYTLNSFSRMAFGTDIGCLTDDPACLDTPVDFAVAFDYAQTVINERIFTPLFWVIELFHPRGKKMQKAISTIRQFAGGIIDDRLRAAQREKKAAAVNGKPEEEAPRQPESIAQLAKKDGKDLLDLFMETTQDREELLIVVLNFLIAGRDTTAQLLSWFFYEMMAHPEHLDGIRRELIEVLGDCPEQGYRLPYDRMRDLPFTMACITEALRLHPSVPKNGKRCVKDTLLVPSAPSDLPPIQIYKGEMGGWSDWVMARLPEVWGADCEEYKPSRFLETNAEGESRARQYSQWQQHMFNGGPRLCLGMNLANFEALSIVAAIVPLFDFHWARKDQGQTASWPPVYLSSITLPMEPYQVEFRRRARS